MSDTVLRQHLVNLLEGRGAHAEIEPALTGFPAAFAGARVAGIPHTPWRLLEHMRIAQWDILEFCRDPGHVSPDWPTGYWPVGDEPDTEAAWTGAVGSFMADLRAMIDYVSDARTDLYTPIPHGDGQTVLREAMLTADHNAYHLGQLILIRRAMEG
jgi:hypothetical protein